MTTCSILKVVLHNFKSFLDHEVIFSTSFGLKHIGGENIVYPRLGANGVGKSSLFEAEYWCFYGKGLKGTRSSQLISWQAVDKKMSVITELLINDKKTTIGRFYTPNESPTNRIEIDGQLKEQKDIEDLIKLSELRFQHSVIFGQGAVLFPDLPIPERGALLDEVLNLDVWAKCSENATRQSSKFEKKLAEKKQELAFINGKLEGLDIEGIKKQLADWDHEVEQSIINLNIEKTRWEDNRETELQVIQNDKVHWQVDKDKETAELTLQLEEHKKKKETERVERQSDIDKLSADLKVLKSRRTSSNGFVRSTTKADIPLLENKIRSSLSKISVIMHRTSSLQEAQKTWEQQTCPVCEQPISDEKKKEKETYFSKKLLTLEQEQTVANTESLSAEKELNTLRDIIAVEDKQEAEHNLQDKLSIQEIQGMEQQISRLKYLDKNVDDTTENTIARHLKRLLIELNPFTLQEESLRARINPYIKLLQDEEKKINPFIIKLIETEEAIKLFKQKKNTAEQECNELTQLITCTEFWKQGFKRIRLFFVQEVLLALEIQIQSELSTLGLLGWKTKLLTETETKSQTLKFGIQIKVTNPIGIEASWENWSGGEGQRLRLGIALGLGLLIQRAAGVEFTFEGFDEPTNWLGSEGIEDLLESLHYRADSRKKQIFIADHRALTYSGFKEILLVRKEETGSKVYLVSEAEA